MRGDLRRRGQRKADVKSTALPQPVTLGTRPAAVQLSDSTHQGKPDAQSRDGPIATGFRLRKHAEYFFGKGRLDTDAVIRNAYRYVVGGGLDVQGDPASRVGIFDRIGQQVGKNLAKPYRVAINDYL